MQYSFQKMLIFEPTNEQDYDSTDDFISSNIMHDILYCKKRDGVVGGKIGLFEGGIQKGLKMVKRYHEFVEKARTRGQCQSNLDRLSVL